MIGVFNAGEGWLWLGLSRSLSSSFFLKKNGLMSLMEERLGCGLVSRGLSRLLFYKKKMIGVLNAVEGWL